MRYTKIANKLTVLDVGCRYGIHPTWSNVDDKILVYLGVDIDKNEILRLKNKYRKRTNIKLINTALSNESKVRNYYILNHKGCSSLHQPDKNSNWFKKYRKGEGKIENIEEVETITMDNLCYNMKLFPDFIKSDTEGHDFEVLNGGKKVLKNVLGVRCEAQFESTYKEQKIFTDIFEFMKDMGFTLLNLDYDGKGNPYSNLADNRYGILTSTDACFIRKSDYLTNKNDIFKIIIFLYHNNASDVAFYYMNKFKKIFAKNCNFSKYIKLLTLKKINTFLNKPCDTYKKCIKTYENIYGERFPEKNQFFESEFINP